MPITNAQIAALPDYSSSEQLKVWRKASVDLASIGEAYDIHGQRLTRSNADYVLRMIAFWQEQVNIESGDGDTALVQFGEP